MSNYKDLYAYFLGGGNIEVWPTEGADKITIEAAAFFAWLTVRGYAYDYSAYPEYNEIWVDEDSLLTWAEWWADPRVISQPGKFNATTNLLDALLCMYLNDPANERFTDCRTVADLPTEFLTPAEKVAKQTEQ